MVTPVLHATPTLESGDRLTPEEFDRIYAQCDDIRAELIDGVVYVTSPVRFKGHGRPHGQITTVLYTYSARANGVLAAADTSVLFSDGIRVQPDVALFWDEAHGGTAHENEEDYLEGSPELVAEVAGSSASQDLHGKMRAYERNGVREYIVWRTRDRAIDYFVLRDGSYVRIEPDADGIVESEVFPGLRLSVKCLLDGDLAGALAALIA